MPIAPAPTSPPRRHHPRTAVPRAALALALALALVGCSAGSAPQVRPGGAPPTASPGDPVTPDEDAGPDGRATDVADVVTVRVDGDELLLDDVDGTRVLATVDDAELLHAALRPGVDRPRTVLVLTRAEDRFELRYLDVLDDEVSELFGLPFRLQVDPEAADVADVPPLPVWSPDGERIAWLEGTAQGTRLRVLGWLTFDRQRSNPSEDRGDWDLDGVPVGTQLEGWEVDRDGTPVLVSAVSAGERWRIRLEDGGPIAAAGLVGAGTSTPRDPVPSRAA